MSSENPGYLIQTEQPLPDGLTLIQTIQKVIVGMTGMTPSKVRPKWQINGPKQDPLPTDDYCMFGVTTTMADANSYNVVDNDGDGSKMQRHEELSVLCSFYGSECVNNARKLRDGFQIAQNRDALTAANMGFKESGQISYVPEVHGQVWFPRADIQIILRREVIKSFEVLSFVGSEGTIQAQLDNNEIQDVPFNVEDEP